MIDVSETETKDLLVELFKKHITVHSFNDLDEVGYARVVDEARSQATVVITDDACRPTNAVASTSYASLYSQSSQPVVVPGRASASPNQTNTVCDTKLCKLCQLLVPNLKNSHLFAENALYCNHDFNFSVNCIC